MERVTQIDDSHCGPAVIQMLLSNLNVHVTQQQVTVAGEATDTIEEHGMRVDQLARAVQQLHPGIEFWYKEKSSLADIASIVSKEGYPVGVEWQGIFEVSAEAHDEGDYGHYSVITHVDIEKRLLVIADPYKEYANRDRLLDFGSFLSRWWDTNEVIETVTGRAKTVTDERMMFVVVPQGESFPMRYGMTRVNVDTAAVASVI